MLALEVKGLSKALGGKGILHGVSFGVEEGDLTAVIGPSGGGKSTLFRCILGELRPEVGRIMLAGEDVTDMPIEKRGIGVVYQSYALFPHLDVEQNVGYGLRARGIRGNAARARIREVLDLVKLASKEDKYPHQLSGGERQRVALARALAVRPKLLLLDEAFGSLDATTRTQMVHEIRSIIQRLNMTTLLITHDQEEAVLFSRHILVLNAGRVVLFGPTESLMTHPDPFVQDFVKMLAFSQGRVRVDPETGPFVVLKGGTRIPIQIPGAKEGQAVHIMVKKGAQAETIEVWSDDSP